MISEPTMKKQIIIGLTGHASAGKDTAASHILDMYSGNGCTAAFADALREEVCRAFTVDPYILTCRATKEQPTPALALHRCRDAAFVQGIQEHYYGGTREGGIEGEHLDLAAPRSPRQIMQLWGTEYRRHRNGPGYWTAKMRRHIQRNGQDLIVITDVRFANEADLVRELGGKLIQITRPGTAEAANQHISETTGAEFAPDATVHNSGTLADLRQCLAAALHEIFPGRVAYEDA